MHRKRRHMNTSVVRINYPGCASILTIVWKHAQANSILKPGKDPELSSSYRHVSLLGTIGKLFEKMLLARILHEVNVRGLLRNEQFRPIHSTSLQLARLVERTTRRKEANRRSLPRRGQSLRYPLDRWPPLQANTPNLPVLHNQYRRRQPTACVPSVARGTISNGTLSDMKYSNYDLIKNQIFN